MRWSILEDYGVYSDCLWSFFLIISEHWWYTVMRLLCYVGQANTIEHEERYYRKVRPGLQTATQTRLDVQQPPCRSLLRPMKHCNSDGMLLMRHQSNDLKQTSLVDCHQSRQQLTTSFPPTSTQLDDRVCAIKTVLLILLIIEKLT